MPLLERNAHIPCKPVMAQDHPFNTNLRFSTQPCKMCNMPGFGTVWDMSTSQGCATSAGDVRSSSFKSFFCETGSPVLGSKSLKYEIMRSTWNLSVMLKPNSVPWSVNQWPLLCASLAVSAKLKQKQRMECSNVDQR